jgi:putative ABC transport system permease protein
MLRYLQAFEDTFTAAVNTLRANKLRSALTLLGIVIGVVAIISMAATTEGLRRRINADLQSLGTGVFQVQKWPQNGNWRDRWKYEKRKNFTLDNVEQLQQACGSCLRIAAEAWSPPVTVMSTNGTAVQGVALAGGTANFFDNNGFNLGAGRLYTEAEAMGGADVLVLGRDVTDVLFPDVNPVDQEVRIKSRVFRVIGVLESRGSGLGGSFDKLVVMPIRTFLLLSGERQAIALTIQAADPAKLGRTQDQVITALRRLRAVPPHAENDFEMFSNDSMQESFEEMTGTIEFASIGISAISLLIGGIGVMNIMFVAVTERTSEIGVRRALGARRRRILAQFSTEAIMLTSFGGILGILLGWFVSYLVRMLVGIPTVVPMWAIILSMASAGGIGLLFGIYPAFRASQLDPVEAMRHE